jgi:pyridoxine kinase
MYVPKNFLSIYRDELIPLSNICTPNQFETEILTEKRKKIISESDVWNSLEWFHERNVKTVVMTSSHIKGSKVLMNYLSHLNCNGKNERFKLAIPRQGGHIRFTGVGDLFAALFLGNSCRYPDDLGKTLESSVASLQSVISFTLNQLKEGD